MAEPDALLEALDALAPAFRDSGLDEIEVEVGTLAIRLVRPRVGTGEAAAPAEATPAPGGAPRSEPADVSPPSGEPSGKQQVAAPLTGVWYSAPSPDARPYVQEGGQIVAGQVIGLIEAMKLFNEIKSDVSGTVSRILVENGQLVKRQQPLLEITLA